MRVCFDSIYDFFRGVCDGDTVRIDRPGVDRSGERISRSLVQVTLM